jgi:putative ABC transport system permease protein
MKYKMAFLNILRNYRRSVITLAAIIFGFISLVLFGGFVSSMYEGMRENMIRSELGHIQIYANGYNQYANKEPEKYLISQEATQEIINLVETVDGVMLVAERLNFSGLVSDGRQSTAIVGVGIDSDNESLLSSAISVIEGEDLFPDDVDGALIGEGLYHSLDAKVGNYLTLLGSTADGTINAVDIKIKGVIRSGVKEVDNRLVRMNLAHAQTLVYSDAVTRLVVLLDETTKTDKVAANLTQTFKKRELDLELRTWWDLAEYYHQVVALFDGVFGFIKVIVLFIVALSISNTMMMAVMERTKEIGTIRAIGGTPFEVSSIFIIEALFLGIIGSALGLGLGALLAEVITIAQWMMPRPPGSTQDYPIRIFIEFPVFIQTMCLGVGIAVISSIYPAVKASKIQVSEALRFT